MVLEPLEVPVRAFGSSFASGPLAWLGVLLPLLVGSTAGCGPTLYSVQILPAARAVAEAEEMGAPEHAPYEYYFARANLDKAREEMGEANYQDAIRFAALAEEYGVKARRLARRRLREAGR